MGIPDSSLLDLIEKVRSWISWGVSDLSCFTGEEFGMLRNGVCKKMCCCECDMKFVDEFSHRYRCQSCGRWLCSKCVERYESPVVVDQSDNVKGNDFSRMMSVKSCKFCCDGVNARHENGGRKYCEKVHPSESPRESPEPPSPCSVNSGSIKSDHLAQYLEARDCGFSLHAVTGKSMISFSTHPSPVSTRRSPRRYTFALIAIIMLEYFFM